MPSTTPPPHRAERWAWALNLLVLVPVLPLLLQRGFVVQHDISMSDHLHSHLPYRAALGSIVASGHLPLWLPDVFGGTPLWAQIEAGAAFPLHVVAYALLNPYTATNLCQVLEILLASTGAWLLARRLGIDPRAAALAGLGFAWSGFMVSHLRHPNMHAAAALMPWLLWAGERVLDRRRGAGPLLAALVALQLSAGHPQVTWLTLVLLGARAATAWRGVPRAYLRGMAVVAGAGALGLALTAVLLLPSWAFTEAAMGRVSFGWDYVTAFPLAPRELLGMIDPAWIGSMEGYDYRGEASLPWGNYGYVGVGTLVLALVGVAGGLRRGWTRFLGVALLIATLLALGDATPLLRLVWLVLPGARLFRFANRFMLVSELALALLAAGGLALLCRWVERRAAGIARWLPLLVLVGVLADQQHHHRIRMPIDGRAHWDNPAALRALVGDLPAEGRSYTLDELDLWERAFHRAEGFRAGFEPYRALWEVPICSSGVMLGLRSASGYTRMLHHRSAAFWQLYDRPSVYPRYHPPERGDEPGRLDPRMRSLLDRGNVRMVLSAAPLDEPGIEPLGVATLRVYRNDHALPRAYLASDWQAVDDLPGAARWMLRDGLAMPWVPALEGGPPGHTTGEAAPRALAVEEHGPNRIALTLPADHTGGLVVLTDSFDEGWVAAVDGQAAPILPANGYQRGVLVQAGARVVTMRYAPPGWRGGALISLAASLALLGWALMERRSARAGATAPAAR